ncbi:MAG TPA: M56 family metallopeptidase [Pyrinomonadaceae bacterium]|nr:M56 family metallopeptidase [Pyrinomonadaceae bacterium]
MIDYSGAASSAISLAINLTVVGSFFAAGTALAFRLARALSPRLRYVVALTASLAAVALPINSTLVGAREPAAFPVAALAEPGQRPTAADVVSNRGGEGAAESGGRAGFAAEAATVVGRPDHEPPGRIPSLLSAFIRRSAESGAGVGFLYLWTFVAVVLLGRETFGYIHLARSRGAWRPAGPEVLSELRWPDAYPLFISESEGPYTVGFFRPAVVMPARLLGDISLDEARLIARHELAHARWRDPLINAFLRVIRAILWPSLPLWFLVRAVRVEREAAADFSAVAESSRDDIEGAATEYAALLVRVARLSGGSRAGSGRYHRAATAAGERVDLESRVSRLLLFSSRTTRARLSLAALALTAAAWASISPPVEARPGSVARDSKTADTAAAVGDEASPAGQESGVRTTASQNVFPATAGKNPRLTSGEWLIRNDPAREAAESATTAQPGAVRGDDQNIVGRALTPPGARSGVGEADQDFVNEMAALGYARLSPQQLAAMKAYGVSASYVAEMAASGYDKLAADALINFRLLGVSSAYVGEMGRLGYSALPPNTMIDFRLYGVSPAYVNELASLGLSNLPAGKLIAFRRAGIDAGYIKQIRSGLEGELSSDHLLALRRLGVTGGYVKDLKARGAENLTAGGVIDALTQRVAAGTSPLRRGHEQ